MWKHKFEESKLALDTFETLYSLITETMNIASKRKLGLAMGYSDGNATQTG